MVTAFANNHAMTAIHGTPSVIYTDPVALGDSDRATANFNVHYLWKTGNGTATVSYQAQVSNDGTNWVTVTALTDSAVSAELRQVSNKGVYGAFIRFYFTLSLTGGSSGDLAGTCFDLHVLVDKA